MGDILSGIGRFAIHVLFIADPIRTSVGILVGMFLAVVYRVVVAPLLSLLILMPTLSGLAGWELIVIGVVIIHYKTIKTYLTKNHPLDPHTEQALALIALAKKNKVPKARIDQMYFNLFEKHLAGRRDPVDAVLGSAKQEKSSEVKAD